MARVYSFDGAGKTVAATSVQTLRFNQSDIPGQGVVAYHLVFSGANNDLGAVTRIRVRSNGVPFLDVSPTQLIAYMNTYSRNQALLATTAQRWTIPLYDLAAVTMDGQDQCQFPVLGAPEVEITTDNSTSAGQILCGYTLTDTPAALSPLLVSSPMNVAASQTNAKYSFAEAGQVRGVYMPHTGLQRLQVYLGGQLALHGSGPAWAAGTYGDMLAEFERVYGAGQDPAVPFQRIDIGRNAPPGSHVALDTGSGWGGVGNEMTLYAMRANSPAAA